ncbi:MAG: Crp/Fnr family transcriptional regulator [Clostridia bacterium]|nr:Crp/Fnr family transcriptional regulator [Clostridia bacterium]
MENLKKCKLFNGFTDSQFENFLKNIQSTVKTYKSNNLIYSAGTTINKFGIIVDGVVDVVYITNNGDINLMSTLKSSDMICESACFTSNKKIPFSIFSKTQCKIFFIDSKILFDTEFVKQEFYPIFIKNFLSILAQSNVEKAQKMDILSRRSIQEKVLSYLDKISKMKNSKTFLVPYNREELATFLAVDRSALSRELSNMKKKKLIDYTKNKFTIF